MGLACGLLAWVLTAAVYGAEDAFKHLPIHWSWWPAIGGLVIGIGGLMDVRALGVGYGTIGDELGGRIALGGLALLLVVKLAIWAIGLGSGTSGGVLAPQLLIGAAAGGLLGHAFGGHPGVWAVLGMGATLAGAMRAPLTAIVFAVELTHAAGLVLPLLVASATAFLLSVLLLKRSIITEKVARRGFHVMREYAVDPLEAMFVREVMRTRGIGGVEVADVDAVVAFPDEVLRAVAGRMAAHEVDELTVVDRETGLPVGVVTVFDLLAARRRQFAGRAQSRATATAAAAPPAGQPPLIAAITSRRERSRNRRVEARALAVDVDMDVPAQGRALLDETVTQPGPLRLERVDRLEHRRRLDLDPARQPGEERRQRSREPDVGHV